MEGSRSRRTRRYVIALFLLTLMGALNHARRLRTEEDYLSMLEQGNQDAATYKEYKERFLDDAGIIVIATGSHLCTREGWETLQRLTDDLAHLPAVHRVFALTTAPYAYTNTDQSAVITPFKKIRVASERERCTIASAYAPYRGLLINDTGTVMALYVVTEETPDRQAKAIAKDLEGVIAQHRPVFQRGFCAGTRNDCGGDLLPGGDVLLRVEIAKGVNQTTLLYGAVILVMFFTGWGLTRSLRTGILTATTGFCAALFTFGLMGLMGIPRNPENAVIINLLIPIGAMYTIHAQGYVARHKEIESWLPKEAIAPYLFATITTMLGFGATAWSVSPAIQQYGMLGAFGVLMCLFTTFTLTFPLLRVKKLDGNSQTSKRILPIIILTRAQTLLLIGALGVASMVGISQLRANYSPVEYLSLTNSVRQDMEEQIKHAGIIPISLAVITHEAGAALNPTLHVTLHELVRELKAAFPGLEAAELYEHIATAYKVLSGEERGASFPKTPDGMAQLLLLFDEEDLEPFIDEERTSVAVQLQTTFRDSAGFHRLEKILQAFREQYGVNVTATGRVAQFYRTGDKIAYEMNNSLTMSFLLVTLCFFALLRSFRLAILAVIPNILPVVGSLALLGFLGVNLDAGNAFLASVALGLVVDDTGHIVAHFRAHRTSGQTTEQAIRTTMEELQSSILISGFVIVVAFLLLNLSDLAPFHTFSQLLIVIVVFALLGDFVLLPSLLVHFGRNHKHAASLD